MPPASMTPRLAASMRSDIALAGVVAETGIDDADDRRFERVVAVASALMKALRRNTEKPASP